MGKKLKSSKLAADKKPRTASAPACQPVSSMPEATQLRSKPESLIGSEMEPKTHAVSLNFRVSPDFRRRFRRYAVDHDMQLNEVLRAAFEGLRKANP